MAKEIQSVDTSTDTFAVLFSRLNEVIDVISADVVTANANPGGSVTSGNVRIQGIVTANTFAVFNSLRGGNVTDPNSLVISSNVVVSNDNVLTVGNSTQFFEINKNAFTFSIDDLDFEIHDSFHVSNGDHDAVLSHDSLVIDNNNEYLHLFANSILLNDTLQITSDSITIGNSTVNAVINSSALVIDRVISESTLDVSEIFLGNSSTNVSVNSSVVSLGGNQVQANQTHIRLGTTGVNVASNSSHLSVSSPAQNAYINSIAFSLANSSVTFSLIKPTAEQVSDSNYFLNANGAWAQLQIPDLGISNLAITTTGTSAQLFDVFTKNTIRSVEYTVSITNNSANGYQVQKLLAFQYNDDIDVTEYGLMFSNNLLGTFSANVNTTHGRIYFTPTAASETLKYFRFAVTV